MALVKWVVVVALDVVAAPARVASDVFRFKRLPYSTGTQLKKLCEKQILLAQKREIKSNKK